MRGSLAFARDPHPSPLPEGEGAKAVGAASSHFQIDNALERVMRYVALPDVLCTVMPAQAGIQVRPVSWIPACAGMTFPVAIHSHAAKFKVHNTL